MAQGKLSEPPRTFTLIGHVYTAIFAAELLLRVLVDGSGFFQGRMRGLNILDIFIVAAALMELVADKLIGKGGVGETKVTFIRIVRMARTVRIFRMVRLLRFFRSLRILLQSVLNTIKSLIFGLVLLCTIFLLFGSIFTQSTTQYITSSDTYSSDTYSVPDHCSRARGEELYTYYGTLSRSIFTLFKSVTGGVDWQDVEGPLHSLGAAYVALFIAFVAFTQFAVLNVLTGVFCQTAIESASQDQEVIIEEQLDRKSQYTKQLQDVFYGIIDSVSAGQVTLADFEAGLEDERLQAYFSAMEITADDAWSLFKLLANTQTNTIDIDEFVAGCLRLRGHARGIDMHMLMYESRWTMRKLTQLVRSLDEEFATVHGQLEDLRLRLALRPAMPLEAPLPAPAAPLAAKAPGPKEWMTL